MSYADERVEAAAVVDWISRLRDEGLPKAWLAEVEETEAAPNQLAVLARGRLHLREILAVLDARHVTYVFRAGDVGPFDSTIYRMTLDGLRVLANPRDLALRRTLLGSVGQELDETSDELEIGRLCAATVPRRSR